MSESYVSLQDISKSYGQLVVCRNLSLAAKKGEFLSLLGPSGCGKSTILNIIAGFVRPDQGHVYVGDELMDEIPPSRRNLGMVFQNYALFPHMSVYDNVAFGLRIRKYPEGETKERVTNALQLVRLPGLEARFPGQLSGGQQQRVALARALVIRPKVLLLDEPLSNLDAKLRKEMQNELKLIQKEAGVTTIYVTHDQEEALTLSDRIAVLNPSVGKVDQVGEPEEIYANPSTEFVAGFIGASNFFSGGVKSINEHEMEVQTDSGLIYVRRRPFKVGDPCLLAIRPESVRVATVKIQGKNVLEGEVVHRAYAGFSLRYEIMLPNNRISANIPITHSVKNLRKGDRVIIQLDPQDFIVMKRSLHTKGS